MHLNYIAIFIIFTSGIYGCFLSSNLIRKVMSISVMQGAILLFYISLGKIKHAKAPILECLEFSECPLTYASPLPHVLMLTAIVVGIATISVAFSLIIKIKKSYNTICEDEIIKMNDNEE